jgi:hypothetical protein
MYGVSTQRASPPATTAQHRAGVHHQAEARLDQRPRTQHPASVTNVGIRWKSGPRCQRGVVARQTGFTSASMARRLPLTASCVIGGPEHDEVRPRQLLLDPLGTCPIGSRPGTPGGTYNPNQR